MPKPPSRAERKNGKSPLRAAPYGEGSRNGGIGVPEPEPWALSSYFTGEHPLSPEQRRDVELYLSIRPKIREGYEEMMQREREALEAAAELFS